ncbi:MAG: fimbria/pilus periplasmic chaperone [Hydrogenovibrio sp.]|uniref:fimbrial biogenesis chaperone n=1 Tax=Hydrogenovibrio sp. TaxID=2065821 RepID=UPI0028704101|nr:fimbria/pilus periplasmic chaperone [Hydrogenovibrio sp.]MDR9499894.1 fimbria/pilus periplasmic chaperone [Hydrogenovibrio sp.]
MISPTRVVFDERDRSASVMVINRGDERATYRISMVENRQLPEGGYERTDSDQATSVGLYPISDWVRFSPRQVTLSPGERQKVRLSLRKPSDLPSGEYRSHLSFKQLPSPTMLEQSKEGSRTQLFMLVGFTIPVQVRQGSEDVTARIENAGLEQVQGSGNWVVKVDLTRQGSFSSVGKLVIYWQPDEQGALQKLNFVDNATLYREVSARTMNVGLKPEQIRPGIYHVVYEAHKSYDVKEFDRISFHYSGR